MTGSAGNNVTTQWTFRDGRDYVLSLTNTETPNTVSFWISDKITGEEWTGCYDENCIEVLTKRTGCFKSFHTFLSMIKSAILRKSDSVILELLNIQDLAAISIHRLSTTTTDNGIGGTSLNFDLYSSEVTANSSTRNRQQAKPESVPSTDTNTSSTNTNGLNGSNKPQPQTPLNKRKYLIVSYIGEFDKVHYPLPLNYSNPPDLNVMQNNIMRLKAEVTSLKSAKKELEDHLESIKLSGRIPQHSHENNNDANNNIPRASDPSGAIRKEQVLLGQNLNRKAEVNGGNHVEESKISNDVGKLRPIVSPTCTKCSDTIEKLMMTIRDLDSTITVQREEYFQLLEKLENENHFLRHKVETSEKYELELWSQIKELKEKVEAQENLEKERRKESLKDTRKNQYRQSRLDLFRNTKPSSGDAQPTKKLYSKSPTKLYDFMAKELGLNKNKKYGQFNQRSRSNSNSTASYSSSVGRNSNERLYKKNRVQNNENYRSLSSSSYKGIGFSGGKPKSRSASFSPARRFNPTEYITEKKMKQNRIANLRMQKIESNIRTSGSAESLRVCRSSPSPNKRSTRLTRTTVSPTALIRLQRSLSGENRKIESANKWSNKINSTLLKDRSEKKGCPTKSRPSSAESCRPKIVSPPTRFCFSEKLREPYKNYGKDEIKEKYQQKTKSLRRSTRNSLNAPAELTTTEYKSRIIRSPAKKLFQDNHQRTPKMNSKAINTSFTCDQLEPLVSLNGLKETAKLNKFFSRGQTEKKDISFLQEKLSALNAYLETCKPKG